MLFALRGLAVLLPSASTSPVIYWLMILSKSGFVNLFKIIVSPVNENLFLSLRIETISS